MNIFFLNLNIYIMILRAAYEMRSKKNNEKNSFSCSMKSEDISDLCLIEGKRRKNTLVLEGVEISPIYKNNSINASPSFSDFSFLNKIVKKDKSTFKPNFAKISKNNNLPIVKNPFRSSLFKHGVKNKDSDRENLNKAEDIPPNKEAKRISN